MVTTKILSSTDNNKKCFSYPHIRMISEGSCDTEDAENSALHQLHVQSFHYYLSSPPNSCCKNTSFVNPLRNSMGQLSLTLKP